MKFWLSWTARPKDGPFTIHSPWWISGQIDSRDTICAAIKADSVEEAKKKVLVCFDNPPGDLDWRFAQERPDNWSPWDVKSPGDTPRFARRPWMKWDE